MLAFVRNTPSAFWFALVGIAFFLVVFISGIWGEMGPFAVLYLAPAYLVVAVLTAVRNQGAWYAAAVIATLIVLFQIGAALLFSVGAPVQEREIDVAVIHATGAVIAAAAGASAFWAAVRSPRSAHRFGAAG